MPTFYTLNINTDDFNVIRRVLGSADPRMQAPEHSEQLSPNAAPKAQRKRNAAAGVVAEPAAPPVAEAIPQETVAYTHKDIADAITDLSRKCSLLEAANIVKTTRVSAEGEPEKFAVRVADIPASAYPGVMIRIAEALASVR